MVRYGFELSEKFKLPVMLRTTTRLSHSRAGVHLQEVLKENPLNPPPSSSTQFILLPSNARGRYKHLLSLQDGLQENSEASKYNEFIEGTDKSLGIISSGIAANYLEENIRKFDLNYSYIKIREYPLLKLTSVTQFGYCNIKEQFTPCIFIGFSPFIMTRHFLARFLAFCDLASTFFRPG